MVTASMVREDDFLHRLTAPKTKWEITQRFLLRKLVTECFEA